MLGVSTKQIIINQLKEKFAEKKLKSFMLVFDVKKDHSTAKGLTLDNKEIPIKVEPNDHSLIKKAFLRKVEKLIQEPFDIIIINIDLDKKDIFFFTKLYNEEPKQQNIFR